jgi:hypothetical protein
MRVDVPGTIGEVRKRLTSLDRLATATEWERAAIVAAFVREGDGQGAREPRPGSRAKFSLRQFADLKLAGLAHQDTVRRYVRAWDASGKPRPEHGSSVSLPAEPWPTFGGRDRSQMMSDVRRAVGKHGVEAVQKVVDDVVARRDPDRGARAAASAAVRKEQRRQQHSARYFEVEGELAKAKRGLTEALRDVEDVPFSDDERDWLVADVERIKALADLVKLRLGGSLDVDWDGELARISEGGAA